jgi:hypothetical protein
LGIRSDRRGKGKTRSLKSEAAASAVICEKRGVGLLKAAELVLRRN